MYVNKSGGNETISRRREGRRLHYRGAATSSAARADRLPGTMISGRCPTGTLSPNRTQASSLTSVPLVTTIFCHTGVPPPLISRLPAAPAISFQTPPKRVLTPPPETFAALSVPP